MGGGYINGRAISFLRRNLSVLYKDSLRTAQ